MRTCMNNILTGTSTKRKDTTWNATRRKQIIEKDE